LFNALGFYGLFVGWRFKTAADLVKRLDNQQYSEEETITVKVRISMPYFLSTESEFERVNGEIEHRGEVYRLIKQKLQNDTLYMVCMKDHESKLINEALADYVKTFTDKSTDSHSAKVSINVIKDYLPTSTSISALATGWTYSIHFSFEQYNLLTADHSIVSPPPRG
jgi:hypothetical protein